MKTMFAFLLALPVSAAFAQISQSEADSFTREAGRLATLSLSVARPDGIGLLLPASELLRPDGGYTERGLALVRAASALSSAHRARMTLFVPEGTLSAVPRLAGECPAGLGEVKPNSLLGERAYLVIRSK